MKSAELFLKEHKIRASDIDIDGLVSVFIRDMEDGLSGRENSLSMIPTYIEAENEFLKETSVLAIDAGGTNFRAARVRFDHEGRIEIGEISKYPMPGLDKEISSREFFTIISDYIKPLAEDSQRIGFCFSYPTEILPSGDGRLIRFCKEVQAPEVAGQLIGKNLLRSLGTPDKHIVLLNDTVATLLAGKSAAIKNKYDSFIGFILGTGTNTCYIEYNSRILKNQNLDRYKSQIINIESGNFNKCPRSDLDILFDNSTMDPGSYTFEKMFSGGYFGGLCLLVLKQAAKEGVFSLQTAGRINSLMELTSNDANDFSNDPASGEVLRQCILETDDINKCLCIIDTLTERAAKLVAANLAAVILKTNKGLNQDNPVLVTIEGTTFYKLHNLKSLFESHLGEYLKDERKRYVEFTRVERSSLIGAALAALIN